MIDPKTGEEIKTPEGNGQPLEKQPETVDDTTKTEVTEEVKKVEIEESELDKLKKKAADFDGLVEKTRLSKLNKKEETPKTDEELKQRLDEINNKLSLIEKEKADNALTEAYKDFITEMPWANSDECFDKISQDFSPEGLTKKEEYISKLRSLAISKFPDKFSAYEEQKIKSKVLADAANINAGNGSGASNNVINNSSNKQKTEQELMQERLGSLLRRNITWLPKK